MARVKIQFTLFSAFYTPLILTMAGGFLKREGLEYEWSVSPSGKPATDSIDDGSADVVQSAPSQAFNAIAAGAAVYPRHFAQINEMDGFFISGRAADPEFSWSKLEGADVVMFGGGQPNAMFRYACHRAGIDYDRINAIAPGGADEIDQAFRAGQGQYVQQQGPYPQQLEQDNIGHVVARVGPQIGTCAFSSLAASEEWLQTDEAR
ncbi:MAG: ABC transporter substrate-binding protein, partial [Gammaproteobacteria bacterium]